MRVQYFNIGVVGFNRPRTLYRLLTKLNLLPKSKVTIYLDSPAGNGIQISAKFIETIRIAEMWAISSHHDADLEIANTHLHGNKNTLRAIRGCLSQGDWGVLLEDDVDFHFSYFDFIGSLSRDVTEYKKYFSVTPFYSIWRRDLSYLKEGGPVRFVPMSLMGSSLGMFFHSHSFFIFEEVASNLSNVRYDNAIRDTVELFPISRLHRKKLTLALQGKLSRYRHTWKQEWPQPTKNQESAWDGLWLLSALIANQKHLVPDYYMVRELNDLGESQWHPHEFPIHSWNHIPAHIPTEISSDRDLEKNLLQERLLQFVPDNSIKPILWNFLKKRLHLNI